MRDEIRIHADQVITGAGAVVADQWVTLAGGRIASIEPAPPAPSRADVRVPFLLPGFWDCHAHFHGLPSADLDRLALEHPIAMAARATRDLRAVLEAGFTSVRELGGLGLRMSRAIEDGSIVGPTIYGAGCVLSTTGGHGDRHAIPLDWMHLPQAATSEVMQLCDGVDECVRAVRMQVRKGARVIKVCASGGILSEIGSPARQQFSAEELAAIVGEARRWDLAVAAHCHSRDGMLAALKAGVTTIEHGTYLDEEVAEAMLASDATFVPTRLLIEELLADPDAVPNYAYDKSRQIVGRHREALERAIEAGIRIAVGTDISVSGPQYGRNSAEVRYLIAAGMTALDAITALTSNGPRTLGPQAPKSGQVAVGWDADLVAMDRDPLGHPAIWGDPDRVTHVWQKGRLAKAPLGEQSPRSWASG